MADGFNRGLAFMRQQREAYANRPRERSMFSFWPKKDQVAQFWWLTAPENMMIILTHPMQRQRRNGGKPYPVDVLCTRKTYDDPKESCDYCVAGEKGPFWRTCAYVYIEAIFHFDEPTEEQKKTWKAQRRADGSTIWKEDVNQVQLFVMKDAMTEQVEAVYAGDPEEPAWVPTLFDRPFRVEVTGEGGSRRDILQPRDRKEMPAEVKAAMDSAPPLEETVIDKMGERKVKERSSAGSTPPLDDFDGDPGPTEPAYDEEEVVKF